jgi:ribonuclease HII
MLCGIDEAGRGPLAGPLVVVGVILHQDLDELNDSKKLSAKKREILFEKIIKHSSFYIAVKDNILIDKKGISFAINSSLNEIKDALKAKEYIFDGNSSFNVKDIKTLIKADTKIKEVMAASILAKVFRDRLMCDLAKFYPQYNFCQHKGYGTKEHIENIKKYKLSPIHRKSFCGRYTT